MRITGLRITNFGRFRGDHELDLQAGVYAIVARAVGDADRSNWSGKSTLLHSIAWALHGTLAGAWTTLDAAISRDCPDMAVDVELSDGSFVSRTKRRGQSAQLSLIYRQPGGGELKLAQEQAQVQIHRLIGMGPDDFVNTVWMGQKGMARLLTMDPAARTGVVVDWLQMAPLEEAAQAVASLATATESRLQATTLSAKSNAVLGDRVEIEARIAQALNTLRATRQTIADNATARADRVRWEQCQALYRDVVQARQAVADLEDAAPRCPSDRAATRVTTALARVQQTVDQLRAERNRLRQLDGGRTFDGVCPVMCAECPAPDKVRLAATAIQTALDELAPRLQAAESRLRTISNLSVVIVRLQRAWNDWQSRLQRATERYDALTTSTGLQGTDTEIGDPPPAPQDPDLETAVRAVTDAEQALAQHLRAIDVRAKADQEIAQHRRILQIQQAALRILSRGGAQRRIATRALGEIEQIANVMLSRCAIPMTVSLQYGREMQKIADVCDCGKAYPRTATVKVCGQCGAIRGKKRDDKLYCVPSESSGAAEDLAGVAIQLAAARWRRAARGASWGVVALDEPMASFDTYNRRSFARSLSMMAQDGFEQCFVVSHNNDILEAMPKRLMITADGPWSRIEVG